MQIATEITNGKSGREILSRDERRRRRRERRNDGGSLARGRVAAVLRRALSDTSTSAARTILAKVKDWNRARNRNSRKIAKSPLDSRMRLIVRPYLTWSNLTRSRPNPNPDHRASEGSTVGDGILRIARRIKADRENFVDNGGVHRSFIHRVTSVQQSSRRNIRHQREIRRFWGNLDVDLRSTTIGEYPGWLSASTFIERDESAASRRRTSATLFILS